MTTILILDNDVGFVLWLAQGLEKAGYLPFPARTVADAQTIIGELKHEIDLLVVSAALQGAAEFIQMLRLRNWRLKVIAVGDYRHVQEEGGFDADFHYQKPNESDESTRQTLIVQIKRILSPFARN